MAHTGLYDDMDGSFKQAVMADEEFILIKLISVDGQTMLFYSTMDGIRWS